MKKIVITLALIGLIAPLVIFAQADSCTIRVNPNQILGGPTVANCPLAGAPADFGFDYAAAGSNIPVSGATCCIFSSLLFAVRWITVFLAVVVVLLIVMGAFSIVTSAGDAEKLKKGRDYIIYALAGLAAALMAFALPYIIREIMGM